jgi:hypothetical protein
MTSSYQKRLNEKAKLQDEVEKEKIVKGGVMTMAGKLNYEKTVATNKMDGLQEVCKDCDEQIDMDEEEEKPENDNCCKCGRLWDKGRVCDCGCSHRACCDTCKEEEEEEAANI